MTHTQLKEGVDGSGQMFDRIARRYDLLNRVNSLGLDHSWRRALVEKMELSAGGEVLDLATGTADLPIAFLRAEPGLARVVGLDPSAGMLGVGAGKLTAAGLSERVELVEGDAQALPFEAGSFDRVSISFGIRNVPDRDLALSEMARVLRPGGRLVILELSTPQGGLMAALARLHMQLVVPLTGALLSGAQEYRYLRESIRAFPPPEAFSEQITAAGFALEEARPLTFGVAVLFSAVKAA